MFSGRFLHDSTRLQARQPNLQQDEAGEIPRDGTLLVVPKTTARARARDSLAL